MLTKEDQREGTIIGHTVRYNAPMSSSINRVSTRVVVGHINGWLLVRLPGGKTASCPTKGVCIITGDDKLPNHNEEVEILNELTTKFPLGTNVILLERVTPRGGGKSYSQFELLRKPWTSNGPEPVAHGEPSAMPEEEAMME